MTTCAFVKVPQSAKDLMEQRQLAIHLLLRRVQDQRHDCSFSLSLRDGTLGQLGTGIIMQGAGSDDTCLGPRYGKTMRALT